MELLKKNQWTMKKFFKGSLLISSMLLTSSCTINQCTLELHDGDKVEQKSCRTKGKQLGKNYAIYNNKIWFVTANYDFYHGDEIGGGVVEVVLIRHVLIYLYQVLLLALMLRVKNTFTHYSLWM